MSVELIDVDDGTSKKDQPSEEEVTLDSTLQPVEEPKQEEPQETEEESNIPEKYRGKTTEEIIAMHQNAEKMIGRSSNEVGELRKIVDDFISSQSTKEEPQEEDDVDFFADPKTAVAKAVENHPAVKKAQEASATLEAQQRAAQAEKALLEMHPDANDILASPEFQMQLQKSPLMQKQIANAAANQDAEAMALVFDEWKANKPTPQDNTVNAKAQKQQTQQASTGAIKGGAGESRKLYRRADIIDLMVKDPDRYERLLPEIEAAYREKRVIT